MHSLYKKKKSAKAHQTLYVNNVPWNLRICKWENNFVVTMLSKKEAKYQCCCHESRTLTPFILKITASVYNMPVEFF